MKTINEAIADFADTIDGSSSGYTAILKLIGNANVVLLGAQTHGTHEFYRERASITKRLIEDKGFNAIVIEADWPDSCRVNRFIHGEGTDADAEQALAGFANFPGWLWRNVDILDFVGWLKNHNEAAFRGEKKVSVYGMDLFSLHKSINAVIEYLQGVDSQAAEEARMAYTGFDHFGADLKTYGFASNLGLKKSCEDAALKELIEMQRRHQEYTQQHDWPDGDEESFSAEQNARLIEHAERYYRAMFNERTLAWNLREIHMAEMLRAIVPHLARRYGQAKVVVWSHNRHVGDARAAHASSIGMVSLGELARQQFGPGAVLVGFTTDSGTVTCASDWWASPPHRATLRPAIEGSYEAVFHQTRLGQFILNLRDMNESAKESLGSRLERAIGIVYRPQSDEKDCYYEAQLARQFDAIVHIDQTRAVEPLGFQTEWEKGEMPETFPMGV